MVDSGGGETVKVSMFTFITESVMGNYGKQILKQILEKNRTNNAVIVYEKTRKEHYHMLVSGSGENMKDLKLWPGIIKKNILTQFQATWIKNTHTQRIT